MIVSSPDPTVVLNLSKRAGGGTITITVGTSEPYHMKDGDEQKEFKF
jgi:hypothetical protein